MRPFSLVIIVLTSLFYTATYADTGMIRAAAFKGGIGVVSHVIYTDGNYADLNSVQKGLKYLGVRLLRDNAPTTSSQLQRYKAMARAGFQFTFMIHEDMNAQILNSSSLAMAYAGSVTAIEGPNEVNNEPVTYSGLTGTVGAQAYQKALYELVKSNSYLGKLPVLNFTDYPDASGRADAGNFHSYAKRAVDPDPTLWFDAKNQSGSMPAMPLWCTETGFYTMTGDDGVSEAVQADYIIESLAYNATRAIAKTYLYELVDEKADSTVPTDTKKHYGLFRTGFVPKPAAMQLHNLLAFIQDEGQLAGTFTPKTFNVTFSNKAVKNILVAKSDGSYVLLFWIEQALWNPVSQAAIAPAMTQLVINLSSDRALTYLRLQDGTSVGLGRNGTWKWDYRSGVVAIAISAT